MLGRDSDTNVTRVNGPPASVVAEAQIPKRGLIADAQAVGAFLDVVQSFLLPLVPYYNDQC